MDDELPSVDRPDDLKAEPPSDSGGRAADASPGASKAAVLQVLQEVKTRSRELYPPDTMDDVNDFGLRLLGTEEDGSPGEKLLGKLMTQLTEQVLSPRVKVCGVAQGGG